jgi:glycosyl transferase family 1
MIESMGCGTPVIAFNCGSVAGVIEDSVTGSVVNDEARAIAAIPLISGGCRVRPSASNSKSVLPHSE